MNSKIPLIIKNCYKGFGNKDNRIAILQGIDLTINQAEFVMMLGPSGSGKSTVLHLIAGLTPVDAGDIEVCGVNIQNCKKDQLLRLRREKIGFVFQNFRLLQGLTALENVMVPLYAVGKSRQESQARAMELLKMLDLGQRMHHYPKQMSGGETQRVGIARALANRPELILADEPTGNIDQKLACEVTEILASLPAKLGTTILMVTHNQLLVPYATRSIYLRNGHLEVNDHV